MGEAGKVAAYRDIHTLAEMLKYNMKDSGSGREVIVEGNTIIIRIEGTTDIYTGKEIETHEYRLQFNSEELFGSYYISAGEYANVMGQYSALRIKEGYLGSVQMEELEKQAIRMMESCYTKESLESLSREEYNELLQSCMISADLSGLVYAGYETEHVRMLESVNELKDTFVDKFGMAVLATSVLLSPTAPLAIALMGAEGGIAVADGALRISQGDELEGIIEILIGAMALGECVYTVKSMRGASKVTYSTEMLQGNRVPSRVELLTAPEVKRIINANGMTVDEFSKLLDPNRALTRKELKIVRNIRKEIGLPSAGTVMNKTIPQADIYNYLYGKYPGVRGFVSVDEHSSTLKGLDNIYEGNRLDYDGTLFKNGYGVDGVSQFVGAPDTVYGKITYVLDDAGSVQLPKDKPTLANAPYTGRGFTGSKNIILPELYQKPRDFIDGDIIAIYDSYGGDMIQQFVFDSEHGWIIN